ncbi:MAG: hypothetical protein GXO87_03090 [Chlorobi bacterium]|nr:hypothetical protein [Chlorobiota bacterium]
MKRRKSLRFKFIFAPIIISLIFISAIVKAQTLPDKAIPNVIAFTSVISDNQGNKLPDGKYDISFSIYDVPEGGSPLWSESYDGFPVKDGVVSVLLGKKDKSNFLKLKFDEKYFLEIAINGENKTSKRIELSASPYSLGSKYALEVNDGAITNDKLADGAVTDEKIKSIDGTKFDDVDPDPFSIYWTIQGNILYGPERNYLGTIEEKDFVIKTFSIDRIRFDPYGKITMGTATDSVEFTVIGKSKFVDVFIQGDLGIGVMPGAAKVHINSADRTPYTPPDMTPFLVDQDSVNIFKIGIDGRVEITTDLTGSEGMETSYPLFIDGKDHGMAIQVNGSASNDNNFVSFWDDDGMKGRIEGETFGEYMLDPTNIARDTYLIALGIADGIAIAIQAASPEPIEPASVIVFSAELVYNSVIIGLEIANLGVTYESGSGDYAEWLKKRDGETFKAGDVVGVFNGEISKTTEGADQLLCVSLSPIVLGNQPPEENIQDFEKTAFLGQVPVRTIGSVNKGDYLIASGLNDGTAIAVSPAMMTIDEFTKVVGRAWQSSSLEGEKPILASIGFNEREIVRMLQLKEKQNQRLSAEIELSAQKINALKNEALSLNKEILDFAERCGILSAKLFNDGNQAKDKTKVVKK